jgi:hypothetical protein
MFLRVSYFIQVKQIKKCLQAKDGHFFTIGIIYSDLLKEKQGLINTYYSGEENSWTILCALTMQRFSPKTCMDIFV